MSIFHGVKRYNNNVIELDLTKRDSNMLEGGTRGNMTRSEIN